MCTACFLVWAMHASSSLLHDYTASTGVSVGHGNSRHSVIADLILLMLQGLSMFTVSDDLVVYGGDKSGLAVCTMAGADWKWAAPAITGNKLLTCVFGSVKASSASVVTSNNM